MKSKHRILGICGGAVLATLSVVAHGDAPFGRYTTSPSTVIDNRTKLTWQRAAYANTSACGSDAACTLLATTCSNSASCSYTAANLYCSNLTLSGFTDFRLPALVELQSLVDLTRINPAIDPSAFPATDAQCFWTSTSVAYQAGNFWGVAFSSGANVAQSTDTLCRVRCVR